MLYITQCFSCTEKDSRRTDRNSDFFSDDNIHNVLVLERLLKTFALLRPDIGNRTPATYSLMSATLFAGYVQGMSDIMALPLVVLNNEHQVFWCFDFIMKTTVTKIINTFQNSLRCVTM